MAVEGKLGQGKVTILLFAIFPNIFGEIGSDGRRYPSLQAVFIMSLFKEVFQKVVRKRCASRGNISTSFANLLVVTASANLPKPD